MSVSGVNVVLERAYPGERAQLKRRILVGALACFNEQGIESTTIEAILARCDASVGNVYHHFGSKDGLVAALFFCALADQAVLVDQALDQAQDLQAGVHALVLSYVDWVTAQPDLARFVFQARAAVAKGPQGKELAQRNRARHKSLLAWLDRVGGVQAVSAWPAELLPSLIIGQAESYARAWLSGRVKTSPEHYRLMLAQAAWASIASALPEGSGAL